MNSLTQSKIPVLNIEGLKPGTESWIMACHKVRHTLEEYGCFMVVSDEVSQDLMKEVYANIKTLFDLPLETKMKNTSAKPFHGYVGATHTRPLYESMGIEQPTSLDEVVRLANLMWPSGNDQFCKSIHSYANLVAKLENQVRKMVFESYGLEKYYESFNESVTYVLKPNKYRPPKSNEGNVAAKMHTDKNLFSILSQNQMNGLEVQIKDDEWMAVEFPPSSFFIMAADVFMAWSNGRTKAVRHRVVMNGQEDRYSIALFSFKKGIVEIPEELVDEDHPPRFKPFDNYKLLEFHVKNPPPYYDERVIELFCGN
ncbi:putative oxoglutarate/iron-dependent dioxygenase, non-heme dioxygenase domain-containing protein [Helianthus annuus]|nr:putative oxoglutarate/iron-dependent dioxygenase, non-heme dioxygenase domain-containing protein [Helianthus annuus]KAJ0860373.1 putative oxoglutarate/iron-dependent dioxygenase, non-heme dioxygenase domain-containing protein [Helianthus annuus]